MRSTFATSRLTSDKLRMDWENLWSNQNGRLGICLLISPEGVGLIESQRPISAFGISGPYPAPGISSKAMIEVKTI